MSHPQGSLARMINELYLLAEIMGIKITEIPNLHQMGRWNHTTRTIQLRAGLTTPDKTATLAHELIHAHMGHQGRQTPSMENKVDQLASCLLITEQEYAQLENLYGTNPQTLAHQMELPTWVILARQATLTQHTHQHAHEHVM